jgi:hypothetical protein
MTARFISDGDGPRRPRRKFSGAVPATDQLFYNLFDNGVSRNFHLAGPLMNPRQTLLVIISLIDVRHSFRNGMRIGSSNKLDCFVSKVVLSVTLHVQRCRPKD